MSRPLHPDGLTNRFRFASPAQIRERPQQRPSIDPDRVSTATADRRAWSLGRVIARCPILEQSEKATLPDKDSPMRTRLMRAALTLSAVASFLIAAGASAKWT